MTIQPFLKFNKSGCKQKHKSDFDALSMSKQSFGSLGCLAEQESGSLRRRLTVMKVSDGRRSRERALLWGAARRGGGSPHDWSFWGEKKASYDATLTFPTSPVCLCSVCKEHCCSLPNTWKVLQGHRVTRRLEDGGVLAFFFLGIESGFINKIIYLFKE